MKTTMTLTAIALALTIGSASAQSPTPAAPRILVIEKKDVKIWGVPSSIHFTRNNLFPNPTQRCPTLRVAAEIVTDPAILAKYKHPSVDYLYHLKCLETDLAPAAADALVADNTKAIATLKK